MKIYDNLWGEQDALESLNFCISQIESSDLTLSEIQHKKVLSDIDMDFEELIGTLLCTQKELKQKDIKKND